MATTIDDTPPPATPANRPLDAPMRGVRGVRGVWRRSARRLGEAMPKGLFARSILIIITPVVLLQSLVAFVFMERNWAEVTTRLSAATAGDVAAVVDIIETYPQDPKFETVT